MALQKYLRDRAQLIDKALDRLLPDETEKPATIHRAMRYSLFAGGKRLRPILTLTAAEACGGNSRQALAAACAVECVHTYSLIHDDLPCMDNDDFRRGRPTSHKVFGEGVAVLAGDALLTVAFEILAQARSSTRYSPAVLSHELARAAGSRWLIAGQVLDLESEGKQITRSQLKFIHRAKTAALLTAAIRLGGMSADATAAQLRRLTAFGEALGLAFQIIDDILDVTQSSQKLGKTAGKDARATKATYPAIFGLARSRDAARRLTATAHEALGGFGPSAARLGEIAEYLLAREY